MDVSDEEDPVPGKFMGGKNGAQGGRWGRGDLEGPLPPQPSPVSPLFQRLSAPQGGGVAPVLSRRPGGKLLRPLKKPKVAPKAEALRRGSTNGGGRPCALWEAACAPVF